MLEEGEGDRLFRTSLAAHPTNPEQIFTATKRKIFRSDDFGKTFGDISASMPLINTIADFAVAPSDGNKVVLVDAAGAVVGTSDGGGSWSKLGDFPGDSPNDIRIDPRDANRIYVASTSVTRGAERLWVSSDNGATWAPLSKTGQPDGLPDLPVQTVEPDPRNSNVLWAGSFIGVYRSGDGGQSWQRFGAGLPNVVKLTVSNSSGTFAPKIVSFTVAYPRRGTGDALTYLVPVVLTSSGAGGTFFTTELTLVNRSSRTLNLTFKTKGTFEATSTYSLPVGQQVFPNVFDFLKTQTGMAVPAGNVVTSLRIEVRGADDIGQFGAQVRVTTPPPLHRTSGRRAWRATSASPFRRRRSAATP